MESPLAPVQTDLALATDTLDEESRFVLRFISVVFEPVSLTFLNKCFARPDLRLPGGGRLNRDQLAAILTPLRKQGVLTAKNQCLPALVEQLSREAVAREEMPRFANIIEKEAPVSYQYGKWETRCWRAVRQFRIGVYTHDFDKIEEAQNFLGEHLHLLPLEPPAVSMVARQFDHAWLSALPGSLQFYLLNLVIGYSIEHLHHFPEIIDYMLDRAAAAEMERIPFLRILAGYLLLQGRLDELGALLERYPEEFQGSGVQGTLIFLSQGTEPSLQAFAKDLAILRRYQPEEQCYFLGLTGLFYSLALLNRDQPGDRDTVARGIAVTLSRCQGCPEESAFRFLDLVLRARDDTLPDILPLTTQIEENQHSLSILFGLLALYWIGIDIPASFKKILQQMCTRASQQAFDWLAMEAAGLLGVLEQDQERWQHQARTLGNQLSCRSIVHLLTPQQSWKQSLDELITVTSQARIRHHNTRLVWLVDYRNQALKLVPREQKKGSAGSWSGGRSIALSRLVQPELIDYLTPQDRRICAAIVSGEEKGSFVFDMERALRGLIGHPLVFLEKSPQTPVEIVAGEPELIVEKKENALFIHFAQDIGNGPVAVWQETPTRFRIIEIGQEHRKVAEITGREGLLVPMAASRQLLGVIGNLASFMTIHSAIDMGINDQEITWVEADPTIHIHIIPYGSGFRLEMFVQPLGHLGPYLKPGAGVTNLLADVNGRRLQTRRNLVLEEEKAREIEESCPILDLAIDLEQENEREWHLLDPEECLQALLEIDEIRDRVVLEWPEGKKLAVSRQAGVNQLNLNIRTSQQDWFTISGNLTINEDEVMELKTLLDKVTTTQSRFIPMGDGQFLALTQEFRNRLEELILFSNQRRNEEGIQIHSLAAIALEDLTRLAHTDVDAGWEEKIKAIRQAQEMVPEVPSTLQAELREYQVEGFIWMARLAHLGIGACLADDMGLGKTLQALAVILSLAGQGPSLVVAPTSVCLNWEMEIHRFAPTLKVHVFAQPDRERLVKRLGKFDLLITSYTLLQQEIDLLEQVHWQTIVLDEAQAIKNAATKRSRAAMRLSGHFRLITTGTPIENHLGELWNLFRFINPGLLGPYKQFNSRFGIPIEKHHDRQARRKLKKLIHPFMLRRIKSQVLDELPPRTEITLRVEMAPKELQFYEALRQQAIENIESSAEKSGRHLRILAEIMRLRRACCNPKLVAPDIDIPSTKLRVFAEVIEELLSSRHKALVFSQFTGHLALIREFLDQQQIPYKYLDGTTPTRERQRQVEGFQAGEGDLFLISLKAGGLGLNLTAADYVIHMDPWWNPAVEDQAADRAHRIGQKRPVTVYRLVTTNTIEEKIVRLHHEKRELANSLLEGADVSTRFSAEELLALIRSA